jgi:hypothetical protein
VMMNAGAENQEWKKRSWCIYRHRHSSEELAHATCPTHSHSQVFQNLKH